MKINKDNKEYTFIINDKAINEINLNKKTFQNDIYEKYDCNINAEVIICNDITKTNSRNSTIKEEKYEEYINFISKYDNNKDRWIYNIIDGITEQEEILHNDNLCIIIPNYTWDRKSKNELYLLGIVKDKEIRCIRSLDSSHIDILLYIKKVGLYIIESNYNIKEDKIKIFIHYPPSTYQLHIHFATLDNKNVNSSVEYSHDLDNIIFNLSICNDYYKRIRLRYLE